MCFTPNLDIELMAIVNVTKINFSVATIVDIEQRFHFNSAKIQYS